MVVKLCVQFFQSLSKSQPVNTLITFNFCLCTTGEFHLRLRHLEQSLLQALNELKAERPDVDAKRSDLLKLQGITVGSAW